MASAGLSGTLLSGIGNLSHLRTLLLQNNQLSGPIAAEIGKLSELQTLDLSSNQFVGGIPSSLDLLSQLSYFFSGGSAKIIYLDRSLHLLLT
nr:probable LRR receptor-like serine/threonine-protein kinase At5g45780 [Arachis hypogaea]